jgi:glycosyltransferase involved in cell wall biosynthesis
MIYRNISIILPVFNEENYIKECLDSILESDYPHEHMEIIVVDGMSEDHTRSIIKTVQAEYDFIQLIDNPKKIVPIAMNLGIMAAKGDYIVRLDAHAEYPSNYFSVLIGWHQKLDAENIGTSIITEVKNDNTVSNAIKTVLSSPFGVGNSDFRVGVNEIKEVDTVPFGCFPQEVFDTYGMYDERLVRNQDIEFNKRILNGGGKIYLVPDVQCTYYARENFTALSKNNFFNGKWNILTAYYTKMLNALSLRHFIPLLFVLSLLLPCIGSLWFPPLCRISLLSLASYLALVIIVSIKLKDRTNTVFHLVVGFLTLHISYGLGSLYGLFIVGKKYIKGEA